MARPYNRSKLFLLLTSVFASIINSAFASVVSTGNFSADFHITWSPSHVITSSDGHSRSLMLDNESGISACMLLIDTILHKLEVFNSSQALLLLPTRSSCSDKLICRSNWCLGTQPALFLPTTSVINFLASYEFVRFSYQNCIFGLPSV